MHYRIVEPPDSDAAKVFKDVRDWLARDADMQRDRLRLVKVCCAPELPGHMLGAPRPSTISVCR